MGIEQIRVSQRGLIAPQIDMIRIFKLRKD
jgi:hypothetical protein